MNDQTIFLLIGMLLSDASIVSAGVWKLSTVKDALILRLDQHRAEMDIEIDELRHNFGEAVASVRQKTNDVELDVHKTFVRREGFYLVIDEVKATSNARFDKLEVKLDRLLARPSVGERE